MQFCTAMKRQFQTFAFSIQQNAANDAVDIHIDGQIVDAETQQILKDWFGDDSSVSFKSFRNQLNAVEAKTYNVYINSYGGLVTDAMAIHDLLQDKQRNGITVNTIGRGIIASAATYILMAGKNSSMSKNSWFMIHNVSGGVWGDVNTVESYAKTLRKFNDSARDFYATATGKRKEDITKMMDAETWMTADEALNNGFIKQIDGDANFTNLIQKEHWQFSNMAVLNAYNSAVKTTQPQTETFIQQQFDEMKKFFQSIVDAIKGTKPAENNAAITGEQLAEAIQKPFENLAEKIEKEIGTQVTNAVKAESFSEAIKNAVTEAVKPFENRISELEKAKGDLEKKNQELEQEIANNKGSAHKTGEEKEEGPKPIGNFSSNEQK